MNLDYFFSYSHLDGELNTDYSSQGVISGRDNVDLSGIERRISALESKEDLDIIYNDSELRNRIQELELKTDSDTIYDDTELRRKIQELEEYIHSLTIPESAKTGSQDSYDEWIRCTYNVVDIDNPTKLFYDGNNEYTLRPEDTIGYLEIDGEKVDVCSEYQFNTLGTHYVNLLLKFSSVYLKLSFYGLAQIREITLPTNITRIGARAFANTQIRKITCLSKTAPTVEYYTSGSSYSAFDGIRNGGVLVIPQGSKDSYTVTGMKMNAGYIGWLCNTTNPQYNNTLTAYGWTVEYLEEEKEDTLD